MNNSKQTMRGEPGDYTRIQSFLEQALQSTWNAAVKETVEKIRINWKPTHPYKSNTVSDYVIFDDGYKSAVADQNKLINKLN